MRNPTTSATIWFVLICVTICFTGPTGCHSSDAQSGPEQPAEHIGDIATPDNAVRVWLESISFGQWLRELPLKPPSAVVRLYNGKPKRYQEGQYRVVDLPIGDRDLQQCADAAIRLRSDYLLSRGRIDDIAFDFTNGDRSRYADWINGVRPQVSGTNVTWSQQAASDSSREAYHDYLETVFMYAGSYSLSRELTPVAHVDSVQAGDCFIEGGFPGHVVIVVDLAVDTATNDLLALLAQGFTPAQDIHVVRNLTDSSLSPWYRLGDGDSLRTPEWTFPWSSLYTFKRHD